MLLSKDYKSWVTSQQDGFHRLIRVNHPPLRLSEGILNSVAPLELLLTSRFTRTALLFHYLNTLAQHARVYVILNTIVSSALKFATSFPVYNKTS